MQNKKSKKDNQKKKKLLFIKLKSIITLNEKYLSMVKQIFRMKYDAPEPLYLCLPNY